MMMIVVLCAPRPQRLRDKGREEGDLGEPTQAVGLHENAPPQPRGYAHGRRRSRAGTATTLRANELEANNSRLPLGT